MNRFLNKVFHGDARNLLRALPSESIDAVISDPMYGTSRSSASVAAATDRSVFTYDWGPDPANGSPDRHWEFHEPFYKECRRVLRPKGILAWSMGIQFYNHFPEWFGDFKVWTILRYGLGRASGNIWMVQTKEQKPVPFPSTEDGVICYGRMHGLRHLHPCPKTVEEMEFMVRSTTRPGEIVLDCFCGLGSTLIAAKKLGRRYIGCDRSLNYCQVAMNRLV